MIKTPLLRYTDAEAVSAVAAADDYVKNTGDTMTGNLNFGNNAAVDMKFHTTAPASPVDGNVYFDSVADKVKIYVE